MKNEDNNYKNIEIEETSDIVQRDIVSSHLNKVATVFIVVSIVFAAHSLYSIIKFLADDSIPLVNCPKSFVLDAPVLMKPLRDEAPLVQDRWIRGFIRRFITSQFPRTAQDVKPFFEYVINHSTGYINQKYKSLLIEEEEMKSFIGNGFNYRFYPKVTDGDSLKIRKTDKPNVLVVEIDGFLVKKMAKVTERFTPTLKYTIEIVKPTSKNPEGINVVDADIEIITDYISGTKKSL